MTLTDLIKSAEEKLANPDLTLGTRRREEAILHHLTNLERTVTELESQNTEMYLDLCEVEELKGELQEAYNASNILLEANKYFGDENRRYLAETEVQQMAISELRAEKQELMDIIGRSELKAVDVMTGEVLHRALTDTLIRHKWPDEKPDENGRYLALIEREYNGFMTILQWHGGEWFRYTYEKEILTRESEVAYWWNLPEVTE